MIGTSLSHFEVQELIDIAERLTDALEVAHETGIIQRKPANIVITGEGSSRFSTSASLSG